MIKEMKLSFALLAIFSAIIMAWKTLMNFFSGAGLNFVALLTLMVILLLIILKNKNVKNRIMDMFVVASVLTLMEFIVYIPFEFGVDSYNVYKGFLEYQNVITFMSILFFAYIAFRFVTEYLNKKIGFVEFILGNKTSNSESKVIKEKKNKELENGSLEEKPNKAVEETDRFVVSDEVEVSETVENVEE